MPSSGSTNGDLKLLIEALAGSIESLAISTANSFAENQQDLRALKSELKEDIAGLADRMHRFESRLDRYAGLDHHVEKLDTRVTHLEARSA